MSQEARIAVMVGGTLGFLTLLVWGLIVLVRRGERRWKEAARALAGELAGAAAAAVWSAEAEAFEWTEPGLKLSLWGGVKTVSVPGSNADVPIASGALCVSFERTPAPQPNAALRARLDALRASSSRFLDEEDGQLVLRCHDLAEFSASARELLAVARAMLAAD